MTRLLSLATAEPDHAYTQPELAEFSERLFAAFPEAEGGRLRGIFRRSGIERRALAAPLEWYASERGFAERNARYQTVALALAERASRTALDRAALAPGEIGHVVLVTNTGLATPSLEARLAGRLGLGAGVGRTPIWGLGCAGGAAGVARAAAIARGDPGTAVLLVAVELTSLTFLREDVSPENRVAAALFADGSAAAVLRAASDGAEADSPGSDRRALRVSGTSSTLWPETLDVMGWEFRDAGFKVIFSRDIPEIAATRLRPEIERFLAAHALRLDAVDRFAVHPGGPRVLEALGRALELPPERLEAARAVLRDHGNMSSPTCLYVLDRHLDDDLRPGERILLLALGPGFAVEQVLLEAA